MDPLATRVAQRFASSKTAYQSLYEDASNGLADMLDDAGRVLRDLRSVEKDLRSVAQDFTPVGKTLSNDEVHGRDVMEIGKDLIAIHEEVAACTAKLHDIQERATRVRRGIPKSARGDSNP